jgi:hypothetical protein
MWKAIKSVGGLLTFLASAAWLYRWEAIRAWLYERAFHVMERIGSDQLVHWGLPVLLVITGVILFWKTWSAGETPARNGRTAVREPEPLGADWTFKELFLHVSPDLFAEGSDPGRRQTVADSVKDLLGACPDYRRR